MAIASIVTHIDSEASQDPGVTMVEATSSPGDLIEAEAPHLVRDSKHEYEKPYEIRYNIGLDFPRSNITKESKPILVRNFRPLENSKNFDEYGFTSTRMDCSMSEDDFDDDAKVESVFYPMAEKLLRQKFPDAAAIRFVEHGVRKRHPNFPTAPDEELKFTQPASLVHIDYTPYSATRTAEAAFKATPDTYRRLLAVNLWKPLQGPGNDWPLALCDWRTMAPTSSSMAADVVFHNRFTENDLVYYQPEHEWYYFKDLRDDEVLMFRQTDTEISGGGGVPHTSFVNPHVSKGAVPRRSIELRAYIFFT